MHQEGDQTAEEAREYPSIGIMRLAMKDHKKIAAAIAGVESYLQEEEAARRAIAPRAVPVFANVWGGFGREEIMRMRSLWQGRIVPMRGAR